MRKPAAMVMIAAISAAIINVAAADGTHVCEDGVVYRVCGDHVRLSALPLRFGLNLSAKPASITSAEARAAAESAVATWNAAWPKAIPAGSGCGPLCYDGTTSTPLGRNGINTIGWGDVSICDGAQHAERVGVACLWYEGTGPAGSHRIAEVDIILSSSSSVTWRSPSSPAELAVGELQATRSFTEAAWYDVVSVITHELGHALGLEDIGFERPWPADLTDAARHGETMYRWYVPGSTNKRTLGAGDVVGLHRAAMTSAADG